MNDGLGGASVRGPDTPSQALDGYIDARRAGRTGLPGAGFGGPAWHELTDLVEELSLLDQASWDEASPLYRAGPSPVARRRGGVARGPWRREAVRAAASSRSRKVVASAAAAMVVAAGIVLATTLAGQPASHAPQVAVPAAWRLAGYIDEPAWQVGGNAAAVGVAPVMTCPSSTACYAVDPWIQNGAGVLEATTDGGQSWHQTALTNGWRFTSGLACQSVDRCVAGGVEGAPGAPGATLVLATSDGGRQWHADTLPPSVGDLSQFACGSGGACLGVGYVVPPSVDVSPQPLVVTLDASGGWRVDELGARFGAVTVHDVACTSTSTCILVGGATEATSPKAVVLFSPHGGLGWNEATLPAGFAQMRAVSCPDSQHCLAIADPPTQPGATSPEGSEILATADGGHTWSLEGPPGPAPLVLTSISCVTSSECWAAGQSTTAPKGVVVQTTDGGTSWTAVRLPGPTAGAAIGSNEVDVQNVSAVSCTAGGVCTALGAQFSPPTAIRQVVLRSD